MRRRSGVSLVDTCTNRNRCTNKSLNPLGSLGCKFKRMKKTLRKRQARDGRNKSYRRHGKHLDASLIK